MKTIQLFVVDGDDKLFLSNRTGRELIVLGYENEPYLRFTTRAVYENRNSPATYLNRKRSGQVPVPAHARPEARPRWVKVSRRASYMWHDHRIHWMSPSPPRGVRRRPDKRHHVLDWKVPIRSAGKAHAVLGSLDYVPPDT